MQTQTNSRYGDSSTARPAQERLATGLGWFSIGLGVAEVVAPRAMAQFIGIGNGKKTVAVMRAFGVREIAAGVGILAQPRPTSWLWTRVAGDMLDLATLGSVFASKDVNKARLLTATTAVIGVTALDVICGQQLSRTTQGNGHAPDRGTRVRNSITINRSPEEVYGFWRNFTNLPSFMDHLESVQITGDKRSHWKAKGPAGKTIEWDAEITDDRPNSLISWRSLEGSDFDHTGSVRFERGPGGRGTRVRVEMNYSSKPAAMATWLGKFAGAGPAQQIEHDLRAFKQVMETGEIVKSDASIHSGMHAARPPMATELKGAEA
jgi:uncharacterized membrane protein